MILDLEQRRWAWRCVWLRTNTIQILQDNLVIAHPDDTLAGIAEVAATHQVEHVRVGY